jgi:beta-aspartyl-peptidase (threonine type)
MSESVIVSNWKHGLLAVKGGIEVLKNGGNAIDAVERGIMAVEDDSSVDSVGTGGIPNIEGIAELDASIMVGNRYIGAGVTNLRNVKNPISVARKIMEYSPHVFMAGEGAVKFARAMGFEYYEPVTDKTKEKWKRLKDMILNVSRDKEISEQFQNELGYDINLDDLIRGIRILTDAGLLKASSTVGALALDGSNIVAGTSTSGWALRLPGRVADSAVLGAGTYATPYAASSSTGLGEYSIKHNLTRKVCDFIEEGMTPKDACEESLELMLKREKVNVIMALIAIDNRGNVGGATTKESFTYCYARLSNSKIVEVTPEPVSLH